MIRCRGALAGLRMIDARSGDDVKVGKWVTYEPPRTVIKGRWRPKPDGGIEFGPGKVVPALSTGVDLPSHGRVSEDSYRLLDIKDNFFRADALVESADGTQQRVPLIVRFTHPGFFLRRVAFVPS